MAGAYQNGITQQGQTSIHAHALTRRRDGEESPQVMTRHDASCCVTTLRGAASFTRRDVSRRIAMRHGPSRRAFVTMIHKMSRRVTTHRELSRRVATQHWDGEESPRVTARHEASWCVTMRHAASRRFAERHRSRVTTCHDASRCVTARHDASVSR